MKFHNVIGRRELMQAAIIGSIAGVAGVLFFVILLSTMNSTTEQANEGEENVIPVQSTEGAATETTSVEFFANQYGVFKNFKSATEFQSGYANLNTSAVVEIDGSFYIWSSISPVKEGINLSESPVSFAKSFKFSSASCSEEALKKLPNTLKSNDPSKFYFEEGSVPKDYPADWFSITTALSTISQDLGVVRLHLLTHFYKENDCLKIEF